MTPKNIALEPDVLERVGKLAEQQGKTPDELMNEAAVRMLSAQADVSNLRSFVAGNSRVIAEKGLQESDVPRLIAESRPERRR